MICMTSIGFMSCSGDDELTDTRVTNFANFLLEGDEFMVVNVGEPFTDPGFTVTEGTEDITDKTVVTGTVDTNTGGFYTITYKAVNKDNFSVSAERTVMVVNHDDLASAYFAKTAKYEDAPITIYDNGDGTYTIDDVMGGYYFFYSYPGYEPTYDFHLEAIVQLNDDNTLTQVGAGNWYFSSSPTIAEGSYDPETGVVTWTTSNGLSVTLTK